MHQTTAEIDYPYPVPRTPHPIPRTHHLSHSPPRCRNPSDMDTTVCDRLRQSKFRTEHHFPKEDLHKWKTTRSRNRTNWNNSKTVRRPSGH